MRMLCDVSSVGVHLTNRLLWRLQRGCDHVMFGWPRRSGFDMQPLMNSTPTPIMSITADAINEPTTASTARSQFIPSGGLIIECWTSTGTFMSTSGTPQGPQSNLWSDWYFGTKSMNSQKNFFFFFFLFDLELIKKINVSNNTLRVVFTTVKNNDFQIRVHVNWITVELMKFGGFSMNGSVQPLINLSLCLLNIQNIQDWDNSEKLYVRLNLPYLRDQDKRCFSCFQEEFGNYMAMDIPFNLVRFRLNPASTAINDVTNWRFPLSRRSTTCSLGIFERVTVRNLLHFDIRIRRKFGYLSNEIFSTPLESKSMHSYFLLFGKITEF